MTDYTFTIETLALYVAIVLPSYLAGARAEVWQLRKARTAFHDRYVDKVTQLRGKAEYSLLTTIYEQPKLKEVFQQATVGSSAAPLRDADRAKIQSEISTITEGLQAVTEPKQLFDTVCSDYDAQEETLESLARALIVVSLSLPVAILGLTVLPPSDQTGWGILIFLLLLVGVGSAPNQWQKFRSARDRRLKSEKRLISLVDERVYGPTPGEADLPPQNPDPSQGLTFR